MKGMALMELKGWRVEINDCEWVIVHAPDETEAERIGVAHYFAFSGYSELEGDAVPSVTALPLVDGGELTFGRLVSVGLCIEASTLDMNQEERTKPMPAIYLTSEW